jgi:hypothetical protein
LYVADRSWYVLPLLWRGVDDMANDDDDDNDDGGRGVSACAATLKTEKKRDRGRGKKMSGKRRKNV